MSPSIAQYRPILAPRAPPGRAEQTAAAFEDAPELLLAAMERPPFGIMIARGDLGVEIGRAGLALSQAHRTA